MQTIADTLQQSDRSGPATTYFSGARGDGYQSTVATLDQRADDVLAAELNLQ